MHEVADRLIDRLDVVNREFAVMLDLGARDGGLARALAARRGTPACCRRRAGEPVSRRVRRVRASPPTPSWYRFATQVSISIASNLVLHWAADLPGALLQLRRALKPDGLLLAAMLGGSTLVELRTALFEAELAEEGGVSPRVSPAIELADAAALLQRAGFALPVADSETITVTYPDMLALLRDLRGMGETNALAARRRGFLRRATLARAGAHLRRALRRCRRGGSRRAFEILFLTGWAPHPSQPQPLAPRQCDSPPGRCPEALRPKG